MRQHMNDIHMNVKRIHKAQTVNQHVTAASCGLDTYSIHMCTQTLKQFRSTHCFDHYRIQFCNDETNHVLYRRHQRCPAHSQTMEKETREKTKL